MANCIPWGTNQDPGPQGAARGAAMRQGALFFGMLLFVFDVASAAGAPGADQEASPVASRSAKAVAREAPVKDETVELPINFLSYSDRFASAGQPSAEQLAALAQAGFERVIYIAFSDQDRSLAHEDRLVKQLGMEYLHIPVDFQKPLISEFEAFAAAMQRDPGKKTLLHCQVNYRATAFAFLYRVLHQDVPVAEAKTAMNEIWVPNKAWTDFVLEVLREHDVDPYCDGCDWTPSEA